MSQRRSAALLSLRLVGQNVALTLVCLLFLVPVIHMISTSLKGDMESYANAGLIPWTIDVAKYATVWQQTNVPLLGFNSLVVTTATTLLVLFVGSLAAYAFSRLRFFGRGPLLVVFLAGLMLPGAAVIVPLYQMNRTLGTMNTYPALIGPYVAFGLPFAILLLRNYFDTLPREIEESARIDGASTFAVYWRILLPLTRPVLATVAIFQALAAWNEFLLALLFMTKAHVRTLPLAAVVFTSLYQTRYEHMFALLVMMTIPVVALYLVMQRHFIGGLTAGAVKF
ncbi:MAG: carbohydrate ABC transporter permease [Chloroflexi bacterium]|nr:carbohydrate ABC transporter permease [Chloroflexota bacterium]